MSEFSKVDDPFGNKEPHSFEPISSATFLTHRLVEIRRMFPWRNPNVCSLVFCVQCGGASNLAYIANRVLMSSRIPIDSLPFQRRRVTDRASDEDRDVFRIKRMTVPSTVDPPKMVVVNRGGQTIWGRCLYREDLSIDGPILGLHFRISAPRAKFGRYIRTIILSNQKCR